ncbi:MAG: hypothetical protein K6D02_06880, partial [Lachnospiraceae bacterium]|nr:hypothetical protein [Lachnospiraceae bacterium]
MNSSKKIISGKKSKKEEKKAQVTMSDKKRIFLGAICVILVLVLCIGVGIQQLKPKVIMTVNKHKFTLSKLMWPIYEKESMCLSYDQMYQQYYGISIWDAPYQGTDANVSSQESMATGLKQEVIDQEAEYVILSAEAKKNKVKLTDDEKKQAKKDAEDALYGLTFTQKVKLEISKNKLIKRKEMIALADKYKEQQRAITDKTVDENEAKAT